MLENTRKWVTVMDTKAGFISALNAGLLSFVWSGGKLIGGGCIQYISACTATVFSFISLILAVLIVIPRTKLNSVFNRKTSYKPNYKAISFYGYVAENYPQKKFPNFVSDVKQLSEEDLIDEVLEQYYTTSHIANTKSKWVYKSGCSLVFAIISTFVAVIARMAF